MNKIRVIKKGRQKKVVNPTPAIPESEARSERAMVTTISDWVNELRSERKSPHALPDRFVSRVSRIA